MMYIHHDKEVRFMQWGVATDIGKKREINEDNFFVYNNDLILCGFVADGMGGHEAGEVASKMAVDIIKSSLEKGFDGAMDYVEAGELIRQAYIETNYRIYEYSVNNGIVRGMGTTSTFAMIYQGKLITVHVGDSRVYKKGEEMVCVTKDHSYVQELISRGEITKEQAKHHPQRNYITRAMGIEETIKIDVGITPYNGETILICSDGLTNMVSEDDIFKIISENNDLQRAAEDLVKTANENGGMDNITVVLLKND